MTPTTNAAEYLIPGTKLRVVSIALRGVQLTALMATLAGVLYLRRQATVPPVVIGFSADHRAISGEMRVYGMNDRRFEALARDVVEAALTRTEEGMTPALLDFLTDACAAKLQQQFQRNRPPKNVEFVQTFKVEPLDGIRIVTANSLQARAMVRGLTATRSMSNQTAARFYFGAVFVAGRGGARNPTGWRLNDLIEISESDFFEKDLAKASAEAVKLPAGAKQ